MLDSINRKALVEYTKRWLDRRASRQPPSVDETGTLEKLRTLTFMGISGIVIYALGQGWSFFSVLAVGLFTAGASLIMGVLLGFLFGIPRTFQIDRSIPANGANGAAESSTAEGALAPTYQANTNLEQISDWLTKILVGVGLTQLPRLREELTFIVNALAPGLGTNGGGAAKSAALTLLIYFSVIGFLYGYLWARLYLAGALRRADEWANLRNKAEEEAIFSVTRAIPSVVPRGTSQVRYGLWVDDTPSNNTNLKHSLEQLFQMEFILSLSTEDALDKVKVPRYQVVISDMGRPGDSRAGYTLLQKLQALNINMPYIIYSAYGSKQYNKEQAKRQGAFGSTSSPQELVQLVRRALEQVQTPEHNETSGEPNRV